jgi:hypothetical protein
MSRQRFGIILAALMLLMVSQPARADKGFKKIKGEVVKVEQQVQAANGGVYDRLTIRTRQGEQLQLKLNGGCDGCYQVGDQVRAKVQGGFGPEAERQVKTMQVRRNGQMLSLGESGGKTVRRQGRLGDGSGAGGAGQGGDRSQSRLRDGSKCAGCGAQAGQGGSRSAAGPRGGGRGRG